MVQSGYFIQLLQRCLRIQNRVWHTHSICIYSILNPSIMKLNWVDYLSPETLVVIYCKSAHNIQYIIQPDSCVWAFIVNVFVCVCMHVYGYSAPQHTCGNASECARELANFHILYTYTIDLDLLNTLCTVYTILYVTKCVWLSVPMQAQVVCTVNYMPQASVVLN